MVMLLFSQLGARVAAHGANLAASLVSAGPPLIPDLNSKLHPSDGAPWTILFVLTLITLLPASLV